MSETVMAARSTAVQLVDPSHCDVVSRATVWPGGVRVLGDLVIAPGRTVDDPAVAGAHAVAIMSAAAWVVANRTKETAR